MSDAVNQAVRNRDTAALCEALILSLPEDYSETQFFRTLCKTKHERDLLFPQLALFDGTPSLSDPYIKYRLGYAHVVAAYKLCRNAEFEDGIRAIVQTYNTVPELMSQLIIHKRVDLFCEFLPHRGYDFGEVLKFALNLAENVLEEITESDIQCLKQIEFDY